MDEERRKELGIYTEKTFGKGKFSFQGNTRVEYNRNLLRITHQVEKNEKNLEVEFEKMKENLNKLFGEEDFLGKLDNDDRYQLMKSESEGSTLELEYLIYDK